MPAKPTSETSTVVLANVLAWTACLAVWALPSEQELVVLLSVGLLIISVAFLGMTLALRIALRKTELDFGRPYAFHWEHPSEDRNESREPQDS